MEEEARRRREEQPQEKDKPLPVGRLDDKVVDLDTWQPPSVRFDCFMKILP